jgi:hypothetical protein
MTRKTVPIKATPQPQPAAPSPEQWVKSRAAGKKKRLTFAIPVELHARMKMECARRGTSMVAELEALLEKEFPGG